MGLWTALTKNVAETAADHADPRLRGRAYAIPFARVWEAVMETARATPRWTVSDADARTGTLTAQAHTLLWRFTDDVVVRVTLDGSGMTRVDLRSSSRVGRADLGTNARRVARFLHRLDRRLRPGGRAPEPR